MVWVGTCRWDLKSRPIFIPEPQLLRKIYQKLLHFFPKLLSIQANLGNLVSDWWNWAYFRANFRNFWKYDPCLYQFLFWIRGHRFTRRLTLRPISAACPRIDLCTKKPPEHMPAIFHNAERKKYTSGPRYWNVPVLVNTGTFLVYQYCLKIWYLRSLECASVVQKLTILECKNGPVLSNTHAPVSGTQSILFPAEHFYSSSVTFWGVIFSPCSCCRKQRKVATKCEEKSTHPDEEHGITTIRCCHKCQHKEPKCTAQCQHGSLYKKGKRN